MKKTLFYLLFLIGICSMQETTAQKVNTRQKDSRGYSPKENDYAYETESTLKRKVRQKGQSGNSRFQVEKPRQATKYTPLDRSYDYSKPPYFGHKKPVVIRPPGQQRLCRICGIKH